MKRNLDTRGIRVGGNYYQSEEMQEWRRRVGDTYLDVRFDTSDIGHISAWFDGRWNVVPAVRKSLRGVDFNTWKEAVADLRRRHAAGAQVYEHIVHDAIRAISAIAEDAVCRTAISGTRSTAKELDLEEDRLTLGFDIVSDDIAEDKHPDDILGNGFPGAAAQPELPPISGDNLDDAFRPELED
ncbi:MAG: Mu transposase C-terminal domain-containing protein [Rhodopseudomonas palustris]|nr:Mu transposase C-terminal domain-containing protein [Rhodopseudomonas palustris]